MQGSICCFSGRKGSSLELFWLMWLYLEGSTKPFLTSLPAWSRLKLWLVAAWLSCSKVGTWQCLLFVLWLSGFESPKGWPDAINRVLFFCKAGRVQPGHLPTHTCLASGLGAGSRGLGELGLYQAALGLLSQDLLLFALGCLHWVGKRSKTRGSCAVVGWG